MLLAEAYCWGCNWQSLAGKTVGSMATVEGHLDDTIYTVWVMMEPNYTLKIMGMASHLLVMDDWVHMRKWMENGVTKIVSFQYHEPFSLYFTYQHVVDNHNNLHHAVPSIEETWVTTRWALRVLQFLLAVTEVNMYLCMRYFVWVEMKK